MKLKDMKCGDTATVVKVNGSGQVRKRVLDLGLTKGAKIRMIRKAPLGDPVEIELRGYRLTVRESETDVVDLEPCGQTKGTEQEEVAAE